MARRNRSAGQRYQLVSACNSLGGYRVVRRVGADEGEAMVALRQAVRVADDDGAVVGYQLLRTHPQPRLDESKTSSPGVTAAEFKAYFGFFGQSRTARMNEAQRDARVLKGRVAEDWLERAAGKVAQYAVLH